MKSTESGIHDRRDHMKVGFRQFIPEKKSFNE